MAEAREVGRSKESFVRAERKSGAGAVTNNCLEFRDLDIKLGWLVEDPEGTTEPAFPRHDYTDGGSIGNSALTIGNDLLKSWTSRTISTQAQQNPNDEIVIEKPILVKRNLFLLFL